MGLPISDTSSQERRSEILQVHSFSTWTIMNNRASKLGYEERLINAPEYYANRFGNDPRRQTAFKIEAEYLKRFVSKGTMLDVGCSTGEFEDVLAWRGAVYGMELSDYARGFAERKGIHFDRDLLNSTEFFDLILFRGSIMHIDTPFLYMKESYRALKPGGYLIFLATANANSLYFKLWNTLGFLDPPTNFYIPTDHGLTNALRNFGFEIIDVRYPYWHSPYRRLLKDHFSFVMKLLGSKRHFAFWRNMMEVVARKPASPNG